MLSNEKTPENTPKHSLVVLLSCLLENLDDYGSPMPFYITCGAYIRPLLNDTVEIHAVGKTAELSITLTGHITDIVINSRRDGFIACIYNSEPMQRSVWNNYILIANETVYPLLVKKYIKPSTDWRTGNPFVVLPRINY